MASAIGRSSDPRIARFDASIAAGDPLAASSAELDRPVEQPLGLHDLVDERDPKRLVGTDAAVLAQHRQSQRVAEPDARDQRDRLDRGDLPDADVGVDETTRSSSAITMSASAMKWKPEPVHTPFTATIVGSHTSQWSGVIRSSSCTSAFDRPRSAPLGECLQVHAGAERARSRRR